MIELVVNAKLEGYGSKRARNRAGNVLVLGWKNRGISRKNTISIDADAEEIRNCGLPKTSLNLP